MMRCLASRLTPKAPLSAGATTRQRGREFALASLGTGAALGTLTRRALSTRQSPRGATLAQAAASAVAAPVQQHSTAATANGSAKNAPTFQARLPMTCSAASCCQRIRGFLPLTQWLMTLLLY